MKSQPDVFIYTALPCEAKPLVARYRLKKESRVQPFAIYCNDELCLTVTGLGKHAMAAGVAYSQALYGGAEYPVLINVGVAGHRTQAIGRPFIGHKITDADSGKNYYPVQAYMLPCGSASIVTASRPQLNYEHEHLCDMEASAFYETASRFSTGELIQCLKIVSDNQAEPADGLDAKRVVALIERNVSVLELLIRELRRLSMLVGSMMWDEYDHLVRQYRFTVTEQSQLKNLLLRWRALTDHKPLELDSTDLIKGSDVLRRLESQINAVEVVL